MNFFKKLLGRKNASDVSDAPQSTAFPVCHSTEALIEVYGGIALEKQDALGELIGELPWNLDMDTREIRFGDELAFSFQILGSFSHSSETWLWGWGNTQSGLPQNLLDHALRLKAYGEKNQIGLFTDETFSASQNDLHLIGLIASGMFKSFGYYLADYGAGTLCITLESGKPVESVNNDGLRIVTLFPQLISLFEMNHKAALKNYLLAKGYHIQEGENTLTASLGDNSLRAEFDDASRLTSLNG